MARQGVDVQPRLDLIAVHVRQADVEQDDVGSERARQIQPLRSRRRGVQGQAQAARRLAHQGDVGGIVLDVEHHRLTR